MTSRYRGVSWNKKNNAWQARIRYGGDVLSLGYFDCDKRAARAFDMVALRIHKDVARTNFPNVNYDREIVEKKTLSEVVQMARAMSRKRRKTSDDEKEREREMEADKVCKENADDAAGNVKGVSGDASPSGEIAADQETSLKSEEQSSSFASSQQLSVKRSAAEVRVLGGGVLVQAAEVISLREKIKELKQAKESLLMALQSSQNDYKSMMKSRDNAIIERDNARKQLTEYLCREKPAILGLMVADKKKIPIVQNSPSYN